MKITVEPLLSDYKGLAFGYKEPTITVGIKTTTTGYLWWKKTTQEDVLLIMGVSDCTSYVCNSVEVDYFWSVLQWFHKDDIENAKYTLKAIKGEF